MGVLCSGGLGENDLETSVHPLGRLPGGIFYGLHSFSGLLLGAKGIGSGGRISPPCSDNGGMFSAVSSAVMAPVASQLQAQATKSPRFRGGF